ncbi:MAG: putative molybdenum carrier protein [Planctomycetia bacterium]|nr:putative molybdenum carrier protein [Planctomycetia bacterium]
MTHGIRRIISGGQTGADRAALDVAIELAIDHGGWVPAGRWAEDGPIARRYRVRETDSPSPAVRTECNVRDADATLLFSHGTLSAGSALTLAIARQQGKPVLHVDLAELDDAKAAAHVSAWLATEGPKVLNVAGPRATSDPLIYDAVSRVLRRVLERG